ncbi:hypothetical protein M2352_004760 [Azospirillum fermentarium]|uniref:hypothetical protein n=1 Tax=Azospirillum fermentarium TaxID=1233114 RepID=UPI002226A83B|nr:hypothetical protein [Azospirillum fermentarium]MCW2249100.1 hypothetical protein [Azospirillum fermentarium]
MPTSAPIAPLARSVYDTAPDPLKEFLGGLAAQVAAGGNWMVRKKTLCDLMMGLGAFFELTPEQRREMIEDMGRDPVPDDDQDNERVEFAELLPMYIAAVLETLNEPAITSAEQAALYILSIHPEHYEAAEAWMLADPRNGKTVRRIMRNDKRLDSLLRMVDAHLLENRRQRVEGAGA